MDAQTLFEIQQAVAREEWIFDRAVIALHEGEPVGKLSMDELTALRDAFNAEYDRRMRGRDVMRGVVF